MSNPAVNTVIVGIRNPKHVEAKSALSDGPELDKGSLDTSKALAWEHGWFYSWDGRAKKEPKQEQR